MWLGEWSVRQPVTVRLPSRIAGMPSQAVMLSAALFLLVLVGAAASAFVFADRVGRFVTR